MGFLDKFKKKGAEQATKEEYQKGEESSSAQATGSSTGKRIKKYTSEGKPVYE